jgi:hypothetical protein
MRHPDTKHVYQSIVEDVPRNGGKPDEVCTGSWMQKDIGTLRRFVLAKDVSNNSN